MWPPRFFREFCDLPNIFFFILILLLVRLLQRCFEHDKSLFGDVRTSI